MDFTEYLLERIQRPERGGWATDPELSGADVTKRLIDLKYSTIDSIKRIAAKLSSHRKRVSVSTVMALLLEIATMEADKLLRERKRDR